MREREREREIIKEKQDVCLRRMGVECVFAHVCGVCVCVCVRVCVCVPDGDGGGEEGLDDAGVEVHNHGLWQVELLQLPQKVHPLLSSFGEGADVQLPLEVLGDDGAQKAE